MKRFWHNLLRGAGSLVDILPAPTFRPLNQSLLGRTDADALRSDWERVGHHLEAAMGQVRYGQTEQAGSGSGEGQKPATADGVLASH